MKGYWVCIYEKIDNKKNLKEYAVKANLQLKIFLENSWSEEEKIELMTE